MKTKRSEGDSSRVVGYVRVSTEEQRIGPEAQREALARWCRSNGRELVAVFEESVSGGASLDERPQLLAATEALRELNAGVLLVAKRDRLARDVMAAALIERLAERNGARVLSADGVSAEATPEGQLMRGIVDLFAQYERALIRARTRAALAVKRAKGEPVGRAPRGLRIVREGVTDTSKGRSVRFVVDPKAAEGLRAAARMRELRRKGLTLRAIASRLDREGYRPERAARFSGETVRRIIANPRLRHA